jgi:hypothetical protein
MARPKKEFRERQKQLVYQASLRGLSGPDLQRAFSISHTQVETYLREMEMESVERKSAVNEDRERAIMLDRLDEVIATCFNQISAIESGDAPRTMFAGIIGKVIGAIELQAKLHGLLVQRHAGADGGPIEISAIQDRQKAIQEIQSRLNQINVLELPKIENG